MNFANPPGLGVPNHNASPFLFFSFLFLSLSFLFFPLLSLSSSCLPICLLVSPFSFSFPFSSQHVTPPLKPLDTKKHTRGCYDHVMKTKTRRQKRRTSQHRRKKKPERRKSDTSLRPKNVNSRAIAFRLHAQMIYNNNNNDSGRRTPSLLAGPQSYDSYRTCLGSPQATASQTVPGHC